MRHPASHAWPPGGANTGSSAESYHYLAFISYRHGPVTRDHAIALESAIKRYARPLLQPPPRIFRDEQILRPGDPISETIRTALRSSEYLLYIASLDSAASTWVGDELQYWCKDLGRGDRLIIVWVSDQIEFLVENNSISWPRSNALPSFLSLYFEGIPLLVDLRWADHENKRSLENIQYKERINALVARFRNLSPEEMNGEEVRVYRRNQRLKNYTVAALVALLLTACALAVIADRQRRTAERKTRLAQAEGLAARSAFYRNEFPQRSLLLAVEGLKTTMDASEGTTPSAIESLRSALGRISGRVLPSPSSGVAILDTEMSDDGKLLFACHSDGQIAWWQTDDPLTTPARVLNSGLQSPDDIAIFDQGRRMLVIDNALGQPGGISFWNIADPAKPIRSCLATDVGYNRWLLANDYAIGVSDHAELFHVDFQAQADSTPKKLPFGEAVNAVALCRPRHLLAISRDSDPNIILHQLPSGKEITRLNLPSAPSQLQFTPDGKVLIAAAGTTLYFFPVSGFTAAQPKFFPIATSFPEKIAGLQVSGDSRWVAAWDDSGLLDLFSMGENGLPRKLSLPTQHFDSVELVRFSASGRWMISHSAFGAPLLWRLEEPVARPAPLPEVIAYNQKLADRETEGSRSHMAGEILFRFTSKEDWLVTSSPDGIRLWWLKHSPPRPILLSGSEGGITGMAVSKDDRFVYGASAGGQMRRWPIAHGISSADPISSAEAELGSVEQISFSSGGGHFAVLSSQQLGTSKMALFELPSDILGEKIHPISLPGKSTPSFKGQWLLNQEDAKTTIWDLSKPQRQAWPLDLGSPPDKCHTTWFLGEGLFVSELDSGRVMGWQLCSGRAPREFLSLAGSNEASGRIVGSRNHDSAIFVTPDQAIHIVDSQKRDAPLKTIRGLPIPPGLEAADVSSMGAWVLLWPDRSSVQLWNIQASPPHLVFAHSEPDLGSLSCRFTEDDSHLMIQTGETTLRALPLLPLSVPGTVRQAPLHIKSPPLVTLEETEVARFGTHFTAGRFYLQIGSDETAIWDLSRDGTSIRPKIVKCAFAHRFRSGDKLRLLTASQEGRVSIWPLSSPLVSEPIFSFTAHESTVRKAFWLETTNQLITASIDRQIKLWSGIDSGKPQGVVLSMESVGALTSVAASADGRWLVTGDSDGTVSAWRLATPDLINLARTVAGRDLSAWERFEFLPAETP